MFQNLGLCLNVAAHNLRHMLQEPSADPGNALDLLDNVSGGNIEYYTQ